MATMLTGCDKNWGDLAAAFVNREVYGISKAYTQAALSNLWLSAFVQSDMDAMADTKVAVIQLGQITLPSVQDVDALGAAELLARFDASDDALADLTDLDSHVDSLWQRLNHEGSVCGDEGFFHARGLEGLAMTGPVTAMIPNLAANKQNVLVSASFSASYGDSRADDSSGNYQWLVTAGEFIASLFEAHKTEEQNDKLQEAIGRIPTEVIQPAEVFRLSKALCAAQFKAVSDLHAQAVASVQEVRSALDLTRQDLLMDRAIIASRLRPFEIDAFLSSTGVAALLNDQQKAMLQAALDTQLEEQIKDVVSLEQEATGARACLESIQKAEAFDDAVVELAAQLHALKANADPAAPTDRLDHALNTLGTLGRNYPNFVKRLAEGRCA